MAAGLAPMKRHCPSCGRDTMAGNVPMTAKILVGDSPLLYMCILCLHTWPTMDMTNREFDLASEWMETINTVVDAGVTTTLENFGDREERQVNLSNTFGLRLGHG